MIQLRGMTWNHPRGYAPLDASVSVYGFVHDLEITWDRRSLKDFGDVPIDQLAAQYDLLIIDHPHVGIAASGALLALDEWISPAEMEAFAQDSAGASHVSYNYLGHQWALAIDAAFQTSVYRPDLIPPLEDEPLPRSWVGVLRLAERLRTRGHWLGMPLCPTDAICSFLTLCDSFENPVGGGNGNSGEFTNPGTGVEALELLAAIYMRAHPASVDWNPIQMLDHMRDTDEVAYCPLTFGYTNYSRVDSPPKRLRFHDIPGEDSAGALLGGTGFAVSAQCKHPEAAIAYGQWLCSAEVQRTFYVETGGQPGSAIAWEDVRANTLCGNFFDDTRSTLDAAYMRPRHLNFVPVFQIPAGNLIHAYLINGMDAPACYTALRRLYEASLEAS